MIRRWQIALGFAFFGCSHSARPPSPDEIPETITIQGSDMTEGYALGVLRREISLSTFRITKVPITVARWKQCMNAGACTEPALVASACTDATRTYRAGKDDAPITCVTPEQAELYCTWQGGWTPTAAEWLLAARGPDVHRYAWGDTTPDCTQHASGIKGSRTQTSCRDVPIQETWVVGKHPMGAAPSGVEDVLLTPAELLARSMNAQFPACIGERGACLVRSGSPGSIDAVTPASGDSETTPLYAFRCAWIGGSK